MVTWYGILDETNFSFVGWSQNLDETMGWAKDIIQANPDSLDEWTVIRMDFDGDRMAKSERLYYGQGILDY